MYVPNNIIFIIIYEKEIENEFCIQLNLVFVCLFLIKMDAYNLSIMFGPALVRPKDDTVVNMLKDMADQGQIIENLIRYVSVF
jgi:hypothetical protein